jgi:hypothetical protein
MLAENTDKRITAQNLYEEFKVNKL